LLLISQELNLDDKMVTFNFNTLTISDDEMNIAADILGIYVKNQKALNHSINDGLNASCLKLLQNELALNSLELSQLLNVSIRTLSRRKSSGKLNKNESQRIFLLTIMIVIANKVLGDHGSALRWLKSPKKALNGISPLEHAKSDQKIEQLINMLHQIEHGIFL